MQILGSSNEYYTINLPRVCTYYYRAKKTRLFRLVGHSYGGHCLRLSPGTSSLLYSGSQDKTVRSWDLGRDEDDKAVETLYNHLDYVESLGLLSGEWVASGGRGDKAVYAYETDGAGKLWRRWRFDGHEGWVTHLVFTGNLGILI